MSIRVAVASADGKVVGQHFGRAVRFVICEIEGTDFRFVETRENDPACRANDENGVEHDEDRLGKAIDCIADCKAVIAARIGDGAASRLAARGIQAFMIPDFIDHALKRLIASGYLSQLSEERGQQ